MSTEEQIKDFGQRVAFNSIFYQGRRVVDIHIAINIFQDLFASQRKELREKVEEYKNQQQVSDGEYSGERVQEMLEEVCDDVLALLEDSK
jgi:hypothetical protein